VPDRITMITAQFDPISLEEINRHASLQTRADNKYFLRWPLFVTFMEALRESHVMMEIGGQRAFTYDTQYFDTPGLTNYWHHVQKRRKRFKVRSRKYVDNGQNFFEIKLKGGRGETVKYKIAYTDEDWGQINETAAAFLEERLREAYGYVLSEPMVPTLRTLYRRITLAAKTSSERITCDFDLTFGADNRWQGRMADDYVLIETKSERGRGYADQLLWRMGARPTSGSKYCLGMSLIRPHLRSNPFHQVRKSYFVRETAVLAEEQLLSVAVGASASNGAPDHGVLPLPTTAAVLFD
jgi:VTC domain.